MPDFYFDDPEADGPSRETSHPRFVEAVTEDFYYNSADEFSPFGNDDGADTLLALQDWFEEYQGLEDPEAFLNDLISRSWGMDLSNLRLTDKEAVLAVQENDVFLFNVIDNAVIAAAFGQYKIEGRLHPELKVLAEISFQRQQLITIQQIEHDEVNLAQVVKLVEEEATFPDDLGGMNDLFVRYLQRLQIMRNGLRKLV